MAPIPGSQGVIERLAPKVYLLWAGLGIGVAFLATPAKFLAPSLSLTVALDVGRHTFRVYNGVEMAFAVGLLIMGAGARHRRRWYVALAGPCAIVLVQALWLIPALDQRVFLIQAGHPPPSSGLHGLYIAAESLKVLWLLALGLLPARSPVRAPSWGRRIKGTGWVRVYEDR